ncbi:MAG: STAS domain-containing protein [Lachnospiraceae bacterium]|nr:STAS domain-containing protein [Lachnospiraceae bacterium]
MDLSQLEVDQNLLERINPVFNTAKMTLFQLAYTGDENARNIADKLGLTEESTQGDVSEPELLCNAFVLETRYRTMGAIAEKTGFTEVDLPCGYTPRAIEFSRKGLGFVGLDLPGAISEAKPVITSLIDEDKKQLVRFEGVDATNYESLEKALDGIPGELCITTEGLLMYFTDSEAGQLCDNIRRLLDKHGGCWITADPETAVQYVLSSQAIYGDSFMEIMLRGQKRAEDKSDVPVVSRTLVANPRSGEEGIRNAMGFLARHGLKAERMIVSENIPDLKSMERLSDQQKEAVGQALTKFAYWKVTPLEGRSIDASEAGGENFDLKADITGEKLTIRLFGRLDTLTAPGLLAFYEKTAGENTINEVEADCGALDYISSAGLRVLLIMHKACERGVVLRSVNETVKEILGQTGFDSIFSISDSIQ